MRGWDGNRAEPLSNTVFEAGMRFASVLPERNFELGKRGTNDKFLVYSELHLAAHEESPIFRFYAWEEAFGPSRFSVTILRDGRYEFDFEEGKTKTRGVTNDEKWVLKALMDHLSDLGDLMIAEK